MENTGPVTTLFLDIGGVLLTNGWDHLARKRAAKVFKLDFIEMETRHHLIYNTYEAGWLGLNEYLDWVVFHQRRPFTRARFWKFMCAQSKPLPGMIELVRRLKSRHKLKIAVVNNEARELNAHRIHKFKLNDFVDFFVSSCFVHLRKPDAAIYRMALDIAQVPGGHVLYIEDRPMFVRVAETLGIRGIQHVNRKATRAGLAAYGLTIAP